MPAPAQQACSVPDCEYRTPEGVPTWDILTQQLEIHQKSVHPVPVANVAPAHAGGGGPSSKTVKKTRPSITNQMSEESWRFFMDEWSRYKRQTGVKDQELLDELWNCMTDDLRQLAFAEGGTTNLNTEPDMTNRIKSLAVVSLHSSVHVVHLHEMRQQSDENVHAFAARVRGIATSCGLQKKCSGCQLVVNFQEETAYHVVMSGLCDQGMKEKALTQAMMENIIDLNSLVKWCTAEESGRLSTPVSQLAPVRQSAYKQDKKIKPCLNCGLRRHGDGSQQAREKDCKAFGKTCTKCGKKNHFSNVCKSTITTARTSAIVEESYDQDPATQNALHFFAMHQPGEDLPKHDHNLPAPAHNLHSSSPEVDRLSSSQKDDRLTSTFQPDRTMPYPLPQSIPTTPLHLAAMVQQMKAWGTSNVRTVPLPHMLHDLHHGWVKSRPLRNPDLSLTIKLHLSSYRQLGLAPPTFSRRRSNPSRSTTIPSVMDTGAQMAVCPLSTLKELGVHPDTLLPLQSKMEGASSEPISLLGGLLVEISGTTSDGQIISCLQLMYVSTAVKRVYMSQDVCKKLQVVPHNFPEIGSCPNISPANQAVSISAVGTTSSPTKCTNTGVILPGTEECKCPKRSLPPTDTPILPCPPTMENLPILKEYILKRFRSSAFNICQKQPLPLMTSSPPLRLHVDPTAKPVAVHTPAQVPLHWQEAVKGGLDRDVRLGVIEKVPVNEPVQWCSRMVVQPKPTGEPRIVKDYQALNSHAPRQTHHTETAWSLVSSIPTNQVKSVVDCWHGYHSVPIAEEDRPLTTFLTPWGRYRHRTTPQGFVSAGDGYTHRMSDIIEGIPRVKKCVDDNLIYDDNIEQNFFRVCDFLAKCSTHGCVFNPAKFQFGEETVQFLGFKVTKNSIQPTDEFLDNIKTFPTPRTITDVRSWYGMIAQISYTFATAPEMQPFRHLLSTKAPFQWSPDLDTAFETSKQEIIKQCMAGVRNFDPDLPTALATDWSKQAMGFWLCQKQCRCEGSKPGCCKEGWQTVYCGSKFCSPGEGNMAPIEGEAASAVWAMSKCKFFLLGLPNFTLCLDHKPLIGMLGSQEYLTIPNPRLMNCKLKASLYTYTTAYIPGKLHVAPDCFSRRSDSPNPPPVLTEDHPLMDISNVKSEYQNSCAPPSWVSPPIKGTVATIRSPGIFAPLSLPATPEEKDSVDDIELLLVGIIMAQLAALDIDPNVDPPLVAPIRQQPTVLSYARLSAAAATCPIYSSLRKLILNGAPEEKASWPQTLLPYYQHRHALLVVGHIVLLHDRPVIPIALRPEVLEHLHGAHSSVTPMYSRAVSSLYWPSMREDILHTRAACSDCNLNAPSNPTPPPHPVQHPEYPFSDICSDFFEYSSKSYLVIVDRYSNWLSLFQLPSDNSSQVIKTLRGYFTTWGVARSFSSDGDSVFTSRELRDWLKRWEVDQRLSSSYYPRSNKRAEVAVKSGKRMIMSNIGPGGTLDTDRVARALLQHRNCPDPNTGLSPAQVVFGRVLRDHLSIQPGALQVRQEWRLDAERREQALAQRHLLKHEQLQHGTKQLPPLAIGDHVMIQDQAAPKQPGKWTKTGKVVEDQGFDSYLVKVDGSNKVTKRNRRFLRKVVPFIHAADNPPELRTKVKSPKVLSLPDYLPPQADLPTPTSSNLPPHIPPRATAQPSSQERKTVRRERWIVSKTYQQKDAAATDTTDVSPNVNKPLRDGVKDDKKVRDAHSVNDDQTIVVPDDHTDVTAKNDEPTAAASPPPILLSTSTPPAPGSSHNYYAMARQSENLREQVRVSRP